MFGVVLLLYFNSIGFQLQAQPLVWDYRMFYLSDNGKEHKNSSLSNFLYVHQSFLFLNKFSSRTNVIKDNYKRIQTQIKQQIENKGG